MTKSIPILLLALTASGCAQYTWNKGGATVQDFRRDAYECERDMRQSGQFGTGLVGALEAHAFGERCMEARGWTKLRTN